MGEEDSVFDEIIAERTSQDEKFGVEYDDLHSTRSWVAVIRNHNGRALADGEFRKQMVRVAALAVAAIESFDRKQDG